MVQFPDALSMGMDSSAWLQGEQLRAAPNARAGERLSSSGASDAASTDPLCWLLSLRPLTVSEECGRSTNIYTAGQLLAEQESMTEREAGKTNVKSSASFNSFCA